MRTTESYIKVSNEARAKLARLFNVEEKTVYLALTYRRDSDKARKIRYAAVRNYGGVAMCHCPECARCRLFAPAALDHGAPDY